VYWYGRKEREKGKLTDFLDKSGGKAVKNVLTRQRETQQSFGKHKAELKSLNDTIFRAESHGFALYASCQNPLVNFFSRNFEATTTKFLGRKAMASPYMHRAKIRWLIFSVAILKLRLQNFAHM